MNLYLGTWDSRLLPLDYLTFATVENPTLLDCRYRLTILLGHELLWLMYFFNVFEIVIVIVFIKDADRVVPIIVGILYGH